MNTTPKLLFIYDYFYPAYKAGGPIQSLINLAKSLNTEYAISVITGAFDLNEQVEMEGIKVDEWNDIILPGEVNPIRVFFAGKKITFSNWRKLFKEINADMVYLNGMFSYRFLISPIRVLNRQNKKAQIIICPRGMLQPGALAGKSLKKKSYLRAINLSGLLKNVRWHATNNEEQENIKKVFGNDESIIVATNIPKMPVENYQPSTKTKGTLRLVYLSLISEKKNLFGLLELMGRTSNDISLDIYGPVKDLDYWEKCKTLLEQNNIKVKYKGDVIPAGVQEIFALYDASILLTKGENFGHALYESMSAGRPIITSFFTPWNDLEIKKAGWNFDISNEDACIKKLEAICGMDAELFKSYCYGAYEVAKNYYKGIDIADSYSKLFEV